MTETRRRSEDRFERRNALWIARNQPRPFLKTPRGNALTADYITYLADFLGGKLTDQPHEPPHFLREPIRKLADPQFLALAVLAPLLDSIFRGWDRDDPSTAAKLKIKVGNDVYQRLREKGLASRLGETQRLQTGDWLLAQAMALDIFGYDQDGFPRISDEWQSDIPQLRERLIALKPDFAPLVLPLAPWTGFWKSYDEYFRVKFVRDWRPETKKAIDAAFLGPFEHAAGVNALAAVPLLIDPVMLDLVERFAVELMGKKYGKKHRADMTTVEADVRDARWIGGRPFWCDYSCDRRGRIYALNHLNFGRGDHVRSLFRFASGMKLDNTYWLEIHCANCHGETKASRAERINWVQSNTREITDIANDPVGTFDRWKDVSEPFAYVAACRELAAAWSDPENFITQLPIAFDGTANGLQHLALLAGDTSSAALVNLLPTGDAPSDAYRSLILKAVGLIETDNCDHARWWRERFEQLSDKQQRELLKATIMTYAYNVSPAGATLQIAKVYKSFKNNPKPPKGAYRFLAKKVLEACENELPGPAGVMQYICKLAEHCADDNRFLEWTSPSGFPVANRYQQSKLVKVNCLRGGVRVAQHKIADGATDKIDLQKVKDAAAPNFVHSLDAAHLVKVINAAAYEGIMDVLTVHDSFSCLAPQATRLHEIILEQLANMYRDNDPLAELRSRSVTTDIHPVPPKGALIGPPGGGYDGSLRLDTLLVTVTRNDDGFSTRISFAPERVKDAKNAFG
jgi:DNA-dependent RNA polymerase